MRIGVIADTHGLVRPEALATLAGAELIVHAGDVGAPEVLAALGAVAPVRAVRGNNDRGRWARALPASDVITVGRHRIYVIHDVKELAIDPAAAGFAAVIAGHAHRARDQVVDGVLGRLDVGARGLSGTILPLT